MRCPHPLPTTTRTHSCTHRHTSKLPRNLNLRSFLRSTARLPPHGGIHSVVQPLDGLSPSARRTRPRPRKVRRGGEHGGRRAVPGGYSGVGIVDGRAGEEEDGGHEDTLVRPGRRVGGREGQEGRRRPQGGAAGAKIRRPHQQPVRVTLPVPRNSAWRGPGGDQGGVPAAVQGVPPGHDEAAAQVGVREVHPAPGGVQGAEQGGEPPLLRLDAGAGGREPPAAAAQVTPRGPVRARPPELRARARHGGSPWREEHGAQRPGHDRPHLRLRHHHLQHLLHHLRPLLQGAVLIEEKDAI